MPVNIGDKHQADFSQPIELMMDCHRRIESFTIQGKHSPALRFPLPP